MDLLALIVIVATLPVVLLGAVAIVYGIYVCWIILLAICGLKWAQEKWRLID